jgi:hypothetical protein
VWVRDRIPALGLEFPGDGDRRATAQWQRDGGRVHHVRVQKSRRPESVRCPV